MLLMIKFFETAFEMNALQGIKDFEFGEDWPVVYIIYGNKEAYVGETVNAHRRMKDHYENVNRKRLKVLSIIGDEEFNKSATLDIESKLIEFIAADGKFSLQNGNKGLRHHNYFQKSLYGEKFHQIWNELRKREIAKNSINEIENSDLFKLSPFKALTDEQIEIVETIEGIIKTDSTSRHLISGEPGTGKTVLAVYLAKYALENIEGINKVGVVIPMTSLRGSVSKVFRTVKGLKSSMVLGPYDIAKEEYDLIIVDESHRLARRQQLANYGSFDKVCRSLGMPVEDTNQMDWIEKQAKHLVLFYDRNQSVKPTDIPFEKLDFERYNKYSLNTQFRVRAGERYTSYIEDILNQRVEGRIVFHGYDLKMFSDVNEMVEAIKEKDREFGLSRNVAGYAWEWQSKKDPNRYDILIDQYQYRWNSTNKDWVNSENAINEIGCIHTVQGYDINYAGVIIGPELLMRDGKIQYNEKNYKDRPAKDLSIGAEGMKKFIINIYKTLLTRGIYGTYIYVCDSELRDYFSDYVDY